MDFLHKETTWEIQVLTQSGEKSSFVAWNNIEWHLKPYSLEDQTFEVSWDAWGLFKLTLKNWLIEIPEVLPWDKMIILWYTYTVKDMKAYAWITFETKKILLAKEK